MQDVVFSAVGSVFWAAPEVLQKKCQDKPSDVWSVGCLLIEMLTGVPPWSHKTQDPSEVESLVLSRDTPPFPKNISENCRDFLSKIFQKDPQKRPTADELLDHAYIRENSRFTHCHSESQNDDQSVNHGLSHADSMASHTNTESRNRLFETITSHTGKNIDNPRIHITPSNTGFQTLTNPTGPDSSPFVTSPNKFPLASPKGFFNNAINTAVVGNRRRSRHFGTVFKHPERIEEQQGMEDEVTGPQHKRTNKRQGSVHFKPNLQEDSAPMRRAHQKGRQSSFFMDYKRGTIAAQKGADQNSNLGNRYFITPAQTINEQVHKPSPNNFLNPKHGESMAKSNTGAKTETKPQKQTELTAEEKAEIERKRIEDRKRLEEQMMFDIEAMGTDTVKSEASELKITINGEQASFSKSPEKAEKTPKALTEEERTLQRKQLEEQMLRDLEMGGGTESVRTHSSRGKSLETLEQEFTINPKKSSNSTVVDPNAGNPNINEGFTSKENWKKRGSDIKETPEIAQGLVNTSMSLSREQPSLVKQLSSTKEQQATIRQQTSVELDEESLKKSIPLINNDQDLLEVIETVPKFDQQFTYPQLSSRNNVSLSKDEQILTKEQADIELEEAKSAEMDQSSASFGQEKVDQNSNLDNGSLEKPEHRIFKEKNYGLLFLKHQFSFN